MVYSCEAATEVGDCRRLKRWRQVVENQRGGVGRSVGGKSSALFFRGPFLGCLGEHFDQNLGQKWLRQMVPKPGLLAFLQILCLPIGADRDRIHGPNRT